MNSKFTGKICVYTRHAIEGDYTESLANSVHLAYAGEDKEYKALNNNYGIVFAKADINADNLIVEKGLVKPFIFRTLDDKYAIVAVRTARYGKTDEDSKGSIILFISDDLVDFQEYGLIYLGKDTFVSEVQCRCNVESGNYEVYWIDTNGKYYSTSLTETFGVINVEEVDLTDHKSLIKDDNNKIDSSFECIEGAIQGNEIEIDEETAAKILLYWNQVKNTGIQVPVRIKAASDEEIKGVSVRTVYSDGSTAVKKVDWDTDAVNFDKPGVYEISGRVRRKKFPFPAAVGYADPQIFSWKGKYYFIATNDNLNDIGVYVREANTPEELFSDNIEQHLILAYNSELQFTQCFWAPEFHVIGDDLYILLALSGDAWGPQSHMMKLKTGGSIIEAEDWETPVRVKKMNGSFLTVSGITLDMTYFKAAKKSYLVWSERYGIGTRHDTGSMLYIAQIEETNPYQLINDPVLIARPLYGWENIDGTINNEGPYALVTDKQVYIAYAGGAAGGYSYVTGILCADIDSDLMKPDEWNKKGAPVLSYYSIDGVYGPGHNTFYKDEDGDIFIVYHAQVKIKGTPRCTAAHRVHFGNRDIPIFDMSYERDLSTEYENVSMKVVVE